MIFKPKIKQVLQSVPILLTALILSFTFNTLKTHAVEIDQAELNAFLGQTSSADSTHQNQQGGTQYIRFGVGSAQTGYMCYLLTKDGQPASDKAIAFSSPGFYYYSDATTWIANSRKGNYSVADFNGGTAPWNLTPWQSDGKTSNEPAIKEWFLAQNGGVENVYNFISEIAGTPPNAS